MPVSGTVLGTEVTMLGCCCRDAEHARLLLWPRLDDVDIAAEEEGTALSVKAEEVATKAAPTAALMDKRVMIFLGGFAKRHYARTPEPLYLLRLVRPTGKHELLLMRSRVVER